MARPAKRSTKTIKAIPTKFGGTQYRSRLEARFAEWLSDQSAHFQYEPSDVYESYVPDFYLHQLHLSIEVKPVCFLDELRIFHRQIDEGPPWICVDQTDRGLWGIIKTNFMMSMGFTFDSGPLPFTIERYGTVEGPVMLCVNASKTFICPWILVRQYEAQERARNNQ